jgi:hypothetical protein
LRPNFTATNEFFILSGFAGKAHGLPDANFVKAEGILMQKFARNWTPLDFITKVSRSCKMHHAVMLGQHSGFGGSKEWRIQNTHLGKARNTVRAGKHGGFLNLKTRRMPN